MNYVAAASEDGESYFVVDAPLKRTWDRLALVLPDVGFDVVDMDSSKGLYYVSYKDNTGFWSSLFSGKKMDIKDGNYRLVVKAADDAEKTEIRFHNSDDAALSNDALKTVYDTVAEVMTKARDVN